MYVCIFLLLSEENRTHTQCETQQTNAEHPHTHTQCETQHTRPGTLIFKKKEITVSFLLVWVAVSSVLPRGIVVSKFLLVETFKVTGLQLLVERGRECVCVRERVC